MNVHGAQPHIVFVAPCFGTFGGMEAFVFRLARFLRERDIPVTICFKQISGDGFTLDDTLRSQCAASPAETVFVPRASRQLFEVLKSADLVHGQNTSIDVSALSRIAGVPLVLTIHGWLRERWTPRGVAARLAAAMADRRWYNSDFVWRKWEGDGRLETSAKLPIISDLPTGIVPVESRRGFVFAARWIENKGLDILLDAYKVAELDRSAWPLTLLGDGPLRERILRRIADERIEGVVVRGFVDDETRNDIIRSSRWMVTPPHTNEDLGLTPIEARHVGVPAIITRDGGLPEAGGRHALVCEPRDSTGLASLLERAARMSIDEYRRISEDTRAELLEYLQPLSIYLDAYAAVLHERGRNELAMRLSTVHA